jgi:2',3'-cyclic-nucleotide 2'-phosphodiesterase (5'-nucleotidase family)
MDNTEVQSEYLYNTARKYIIEIENELKANICYQTLDQRKNKLTEQINTLIDDIFASREISEKTKQLNEVKLIIDEQLKKVSNEMEIIVKDIVYLKLAASVQV